ncbi:MAG: endonuclease/exonuclease/phosphatase family protein [Clostridia bacterium]|nr:endonuclease/exonuclease/phosphatase family protein [Clostridia bacterium]
MKKALLKILCTALVFVLVFSVFSTAAGAEDTENQKEISIISSNVGGLPIPSVFSENKKVVPTAEVVLGEMLNESGIDIVCVQEDFQFHSLLAKGMTNYPYRTFTSGGIPAGDGLNIFSKYPIYNIDRVAWKDFNGLLTAAADGLTPKGFLKCTVDFDGVLIDVYDIHTDANGSLDDQKAKRKQFRQLADYINENSYGRPILITGDFNCTLHTDRYTNYYETMIVEQGYRDAWAEVVNNGDYFRGSNASDLVREYNQQYPDFWGYWDSVERVAYRDGDGLVITPVEFEYNYYTNSDTDLMALTDHAVMSCKLILDTTNYIRPDMQLSEPTDKSLAEKIPYYLKMVRRSFSLMLTDIVRILNEKFFNI